MIVLVDANVVLDVVTDDPTWYDWSVGQLNRLALNNRLAINDVVFAELANSFERFEEVDATIEGMALQVRPMPHAALFLAGKVHQRYRKAGGTRTGVLPDFFLGAQAAVEQLPVVTRDARRFRSYFPSLELITP